MANTWLGLQQDGFYGQHDVRFAKSKPRFYHSMRKSRWQSICHLSVDRPEFWSAGPGDELKALGQVSYSAKGIAYIESGGYFIIGMGSKAVD
ncbi:hypothetical protein [Paenibacillus shenyangensis]|uniref:hypothetical protein n=1 Tax=Paenibacillus sp. A9 TaxID=1284352 RepID=UPI0003754D01|nr:hypothetical protein [Paenibacillus sp. A9]